MNGESLKAYNERILDARVVCDLCQSPMVYDHEQELADAENKTPFLIGRPVVCSSPTCGVKGRKLRQ